MERVGATCPLPSLGVYRGPVTGQEGSKYMDDVIIDDSINNDENKKVSNRTSHGGSEF